MSTLFDGRPARSRRGKRANMVEKKCAWTDYWTPERILGPVRKLFGALGHGEQIGLDPATNPENPTKARHFFTPAEDGLSRSWTGHGGVYVNPPYGEFTESWLAKIGDEADCGAPLVSCLSNARFEQGYFQKNVYRPSIVAVCKVRKRVAFIDSRTRKPQKSNPYTQSLYVYGLDDADRVWEAAADILDEVGCVLRVSEVRQWRGD